MGVAILWPDSLDEISARHLWLAGAIGVMTLAVMTRAILGHTGRQLVAGRGTIFVYLTMIAAVCLRFLAGFADEFLHALYMVSGLLWMVAFLGFILVYGPMLLQPKASAKPLRMTDPN